MGRKVKAFFLGCAACLFAIVLLALAWLVRKLSNNVGGAGGTGTNLDGARADHRDATGDLNGAVHDNKRAADNLDAAFGALGELAGTNQRARDIIAAIRARGAVEPGPGCDSHN